jgi:LPXTG-motif cell wall-anchored protein
LLSFPTARPDRGSSKLSTGAIAGIVLGALVGIALLLGGVLFFLRRRKNSNKAVGTASNDMGIGHDDPTKTYVYDSMGQQKNTYAYQPLGAVPTVQSPVELGDYRTPGELHASPTTRHEAP